MLSCRCGLEGAFFPGLGSSVLGLDGDGHADVGIVLFQGDDVLVEQADAALAGSAWHGVLVARAAVDADALVSWSRESEEPVPVGKDVAAAVMEVVPPGGGILDHGDLEWLALWRLGGAHVTPPLLVALVLAHATWELCDQDGVASGAKVIHTQSLLQFRHDDKCGAGGLCGKGGCDLC